MAIPAIASYLMPTSAEMPQNRVNWKADPARAALLIHDLQDYFLDFFDREAAPVPEMLANVARILDACRAAGIPVFFTAQPDVQSPEDRGLLQDFWGDGLKNRPERKTIAAEVAPKEGDRVLTKWRYSAFHKSNFEQLLGEAGRDQLIICGVYAHIGCMMTACDAFMRDIQPLFVGDALADFSRAEHEQALRYVAQRCGTVTHTESLLAAVGQAVRGVSGMDALRLQVANILELPGSEIGAEDNILDLGLDSIRIMTLVEQFRDQGVEVSFVELAADPTLTAWNALLQERMRNV